jgi:hypothetical protein
MLSSHIPPTDLPLAFSHPNPNPPLLSNVPPLRPSFTASIELVTLIMVYELLLDSSHDAPHLLHSPASVRLATDEARPSGPDPNLNGLSAALCCYP